MGIKRPEFKLDRIVFDRSLWTIHYKTNATHCESNLYDPELISYHDLEDMASISRFKDYRKETNLKQSYGSPVPFLTWDLRLRSTRSMMIYFNFNRYFLENRELVNDPNIILHDDNFLPLDADVTTEDFIDVYNKTLPERMVKEYKAWYSKLWKESFAVLEEIGEEPICHCNTLEVAREMAPLDVNSVKNTSIGNGTSFSSYNNASNVLYFGHQPKGKGYNDFDVDGVKLKTNATTWNLKKPYEKVMQAKLYQKCIGMGRFEVTLYDEQIGLNSSCPTEDLKFIIDEYMEEFGLTPTPIKKEIVAEFKQLCKGMKISAELLDTVISMGRHWKATRANKAVTQKLERSGIISRHHRGHYLVNQLFVQLFELVEEKKKKVDCTPKLRYL